MRVLLINPKWIRREGSIWKKLGSCMPTLGIAHLASYLIKEGAGAELLDMDAEGMTAEQLLPWLKDKGKFDYIGITATTAIVDAAMQVAAVCKENFPGTKIILGGVHPTVMPDEVLSDANVDLVVRGEGEETLAEIVKGTPLENIKGLSYKKNGKNFHNPDRELIQNLDSLPYPAYNLMPIRKYRPSIGANKRYPVMSMLGSRGCPGKCTYCYGYFLGKQIRMFSPRYLADQLKLLRYTYGVKEITFYDDTFTVFKAKVKEFCGYIINEKIDITWTCFARVDFVEEETLKIMKKAGCHQICFGIESGSEEILENIKKKTTLAKAKETIKLVKKIGIEARASFMVGNPGETVETMEKTIKFAIEVDPDIAVFNISTPYPGTEMYDWAMKNGYLKPQKWSEFDWSIPVMTLPTVSQEDVLRYYKAAHKRFFGRPSYIIRRMLKIRSFHDLWAAFRAFIALWFKD